MATKANIVIDQGTDFSTVITINDDDDSAVNLTGYSANAHIRKHYSSSTATVLECTFENRVNGILKLSLGRGVSSNMESGRYVYDVELTDSQNVRSRLLEGVFTITPEVTRA